MPETLLKKRKSQEKAREERSAATAEQKKVIIWEKGILIVWLSNAVVCNGSAGLSAKVLSHRNDRGQASAES